MLRDVLIAVVLISACVGLAEMSQPASCSGSGAASSASVAVIGRRNPSGHWVSQVVVGDQGQSANLDVDVEYKQKECNSEESNAEVILTFSVPPEDVGTSGRHATQRGSECKCTPQEDRSSRPKHPPGGYMPLHGVAYFMVYVTPLSFSHARQKCIEDGGNLASITTPERLTFVKGLIALSNWAWIDVHERGVNGVYYNATGEKWVQPSFLPWYPGQPNFAGTSDCILLLLNDGRIGDTPCEGHPRMFVCELPWF